MKLESILQYLDNLLGIPEFPDYPAALNGLQVEGPTDVERITVAVDASQETIDASVAAGAQLLIVHHGLFWDRRLRITGRRYRRITALIEGGVALYAAHLPLDAHPEVGNNALLARMLGMDWLEPFGDFEGTLIGFKGSLSTTRAALSERVGEAVGGPVHLIPGGPEDVRRVGVVSGGAGALIGEAAEQGLDAFVTGEGAHHTHMDAMELGVNVYYGGHYATETFGVKAVGGRLEEEFGLPWTFVDRPTGL